MTESLGPLSRLMLYRGGGSVGAADEEAWKADMDGERSGRNFERKEGRERAFADSMMGGGIEIMRDGLFDYYKYKDSERGQLLFHTYDREIV